MPEEMMMEGHHDDDLFRAWNTKDIAPRAEPVKMGPVEAEAVVSELQPQNQQRLAQSGLCTTLRDVCNNASAGEFYSQSCLNDADHPKYQCALRKGGAGIPFP